MEELHFDKGERKHLIEQLYKSSKELPVPYLARLADFLTKTVPVICSFLELLFDRYKPKPKPTPFKTKSVDVEPIRHNNNIPNQDIIVYTGPSESTSSLRNDNDDPRESLVDTTLSFLQMLLLCFIIWYHLERSEIRIVPFAGITLISEIYYIFLYVKHL